MKKERGKKEKELRARERERKRGFERFTSTMNFVFLLTILTIVYEMDAFLQ